MSSFEFFKDGRMLFVRLQMSVGLLLLFGIAFFRSNVPQFVHHRVAWPMLNNSNATNSPAGNDYNSSMGNDGIHMSA